MSLYLTYRPNTFADMVWQYFVKETLPKAIKNNKIAWSYLFTWPKGTGKTSVARIFAKSLNCLDFKWDLCNKCTNCIMSNENKNIDIIEIDAASNSSVENIKKIIEQSRFQPSNNNKYKVYIIDEVHMLSKSAFNALLKIMEEPPSYVVFILATTELDKVPDTILSRCQTYSFSTITNEDVKERLLYIAKKENIDYDDMGIDLIIKISEGSMRNAIKFLDQYSGINNSIKWEDIEKNVWFVKLDTIKDLLKNIYLKDANAYNNSIKIYNEVVDSGKNIHLFVKDILFYLLDKLKFEYSQKEPNINNISVYNKMMEEFDSCAIKMKSSTNQNITLLVSIWNLMTNKKD